MSLATYRELASTDAVAAETYRQQHFVELFIEATQAFSAYAWSAVGLAFMGVAAAGGTWFWLRRRLPWPYAWLLPLAGLIAYASLKSMVIVELIRLAPELPQMWSLYFKPWTPFRMVRTSVSGLMILIGLMWLTALWQARRSPAAPDQRRD